MGLMGLFLNSWGWENGSKVEPYYQSLRGS